MGYTIKFDFPNKIQNIFDKLNENNISPIIVGGYVRDKFLNLNSKDIDIELYGVNSIDKLEKILKSFGTLNCVGKSFGVYKLTIDTFDLDFTLPRSDNKIAQGHSGFEITINPNLDFKSASSRRDFTINAIGYDVANHQILDPFSGLLDIKNKTLKAVDLNTFAEDPLRVLRAVGFSSRFSFTLEASLFKLCQNMCDTNLLDELPSERIYTEIKKILLKSKKPSQAFYLLKELHALRYFSPLHRFNEDDFKNILSSLDRLNTTNIQSTKLQIILSLSVICYKFTLTETKVFITKLTNDKHLLSELITILKNDFQTSYNDSDLYRLANKVNIENFLLVNQAVHQNSNSFIFKNLKQRAINFGIFNVKAKAYLQGRDLLEFGLSPSKEFSKILGLAYEAQMNLELKSYQEARLWLKEHLKNQ